MVITGRNNLTGSFTGRNCMNMSLVRQLGDVERVKNDLIKLIKVRYFAKF